MKNAETTPNHVGEKALGVKPGAGKAKGSQPPPECQKKKGNKNFELGVKPLTGGGRKKKRRRKEFSGGGQRAKKRKKKAPIEGELGFQGGVHHAKQSGGKGI